jgi:hypothetical protein
MAEINGREITPVDFLEAVYLNPNLPLATRLRAAIEAAPSRHAKLSAHAVGHYDGKSFAEQVEKAIERSRSPVPQLNGPVDPIPATVAQRPMSRLRRF